MRISSDTVSSILQQTFQTSSYEEKLVNVDSIYTPTPRD